MREDDGACHDNHGIMRRPASRPQPRREPIGEESPRARRDFVVMKSQRRQNDFAKPFKSNDRKMKDKNIEIEYNQETLTTRQREAAKIFCPLFSSHDLLLKSWALFCLHSKRSGLI
jgi:hypothetical protein